MKETIILELKARHEASVTLPEPIGKIRRGDVAEYEVSVQTAQDLRRSPRFDVEPPEAPQKVKDWLRKQRKANKPATEKEPSPAEKTRAKASEKARAKRAKLRKPSGKPDETPSGSATAGGS